jgi:hypothetical protein
MIQCQVTLLTLHSTGRVLGGWLRTAALAGVLVGGVAAYSVAQDCSDYRLALRLLGTAYPGGGEDVAVVGSYAYIAAGSAGLAIVDIHDPASPQTVGQWLTQRVSYGVAVSGHYAYVADWDAGLQIIDVANPSAPTLAAQIDTPGLAYGVAIDGHYVYIADGAAGVEVVDTFNNPPSSAIVGTTDTPGTAYKIAVRGDVLYIADDTSVQIVNVSVHTLPHVVASYDTPAAGDHVRDATISGQTLFLAYGTTGMQILDLTYPGSPYLLSTASTPGGAMGVTVAGNVAYVACDTRGLEVFDIANLQSPQLLGAINGPPSHATRVAAVGSSAFVADSDRLTIVDTTTPFSLPPLGKAVFTPASRVLVAGNLAYTLSGTALRIVDISNDAAPQQLGAVSFPDYAEDIALYGGSLAVVAVGEAGICLVNASNPASPQLVLTIDTPGYALGVAMAGSHVLVADYTSGLRILDLGHPNAPPVTLLYQANQVVVSGTHAYVADDFAITPLDIQDPSAPVVGTSILDAYIVHMVADGTRLYTAGYNVGVSIVDLSSPMTPAVLGSLALPGSTYDVGVSGPFAYTANDGQGFHVVDVSNPATPVVVGSNDTPGDAQSIAVTATRAYLGDVGGNGFSVYALQCPIPATDAAELAPRATRLLAPFPNPANPHVTIPFTLARGGAVQLTVLDVAGREVARLLDGVRPAGPSKAFWNGATRDGRPAASGVYLVRMMSPDGARTAKVVLAK